MVMTGWSKLLKRFFVFCLTGVIFLLIDSRCLYATVSVNAQEYINEYGEELNHVPFEVRYLFKKSNNIDWDDVDFETRVEFLDLWVKSKREEEKQEKAKERARIRAEREKIKRKREIAREKREKEREELKRKREKEKRERERRRAFEKMVREEKKKLENMRRELRKKRMEARRKHRR